VDLYENLLVAAVTEKERTILRLWDFQTKEFWYDIELKAVPRRVFGLCVTRKRIYVCTGQDIYVVDFHGGVTLPPSVSLPPKVVNIGVAEKKRCVIQ